MSSDQRNRILKSKSINNIKDVFRAMIVSSVSGALTQ